MRRILIVLSLVLTACFITFCKKNSPGIATGNGGTGTTTPPAVLTISDFNPKTAAIGTKVMITGTGFGTDSTIVGVKFGPSTIVKPSALSATQMTAIVPANADSGKIQVTVNSAAATSMQTFYVAKAPMPVLTISSFSPQAAKVGETVTITGTAFGTDTNFVSIKFGTAAGIKPKTITATSMNVVIPPDAQTGKIQLTVNGGTPVSSTSNFTLTATPLTISSISPNSGNVGDIITIKGSAFGTDTNAVSVSFGNSTGIKPKTVSFNKITVAVPAFAQSGKIKIAVTSNIVTNNVTSDDNFTCTTVYLAITSFSPKTVAKGDTLIINGTFNPLVTDIQVFLNTTSHSFTKPFKITPTQLSVIIPSDATTGKVRVLSLTLNQPYSPIDSKDDLTVLPKTDVYLVEPKSARLGQTVTINGDWAGITFNQIQVKFKGAAIVNPIGYKNGTNTSYIIVRVPNDATTGTVQVTKTGYATGTSTNTFSLLPAIPPAQPGVWTVGADFDGGIKSGSIAFTIGNKAYVGLSDGYIFDSAGIDIWEFDPVYNAWTQKADFAGGGRSNAVAFSIGNKGYVGTGLNATGSYTKDIWEYDPGANIWTQKADFAGIARAYAVGFAASNKGYIGSGLNGKSLDDFYQYDPNLNSWTKIPSIPGIRDHAYAFVVDNKAYVGNGYNYQTNLYYSIPISDLYMFDPATNAWTAKAAIPGFAYTGSNSSFSIGSKGYVGLGYNYMKNTNYKEVTNQFFEYSTTTNSWKALSNYGGTARTSTVSFAIGNIGYVGLGSQVPGSTTPYKDFWSYTP